MPKITQKPAFIAFMGHKRAEQGMDCSVDDFGHGNRIRAQRIVNHLTFFTSTIQRAEHSSELNVRKLCSANKRPAEVKPLLYQCCFYYVSHALVKTAGSST